MKDFSPEIWAKNMGAHHTRQNMVISEGLHQRWLEKDFCKECILNMLSTSFFILCSIKNENCINKINMSYR